MTAIVVRIGTIAEAVTVLASISELDSGINAKMIRLRLAHQPALILVAEYQQQLVGVKVGYALSEQVFYSWLGGVLACGRGLGIAQKLLEAQEAWVMAQSSYTTINVKSHNCFPAMVRLLFRNGYAIENIEKKGQLRDYRLGFTKQI
ncbi:GNAT family N-acetyltransferase [Photobacterium kishitanii]|uniref:GNAT family N-acetyltransferase n=1 Tax=Photobacterium kishitanii TaxID=318456 RepID=UPI000D1750E3|nr:GNAT family N-acetyltransferase [Photobacterium kishitanii]PSU92453.1 GNAT family N-acetyltransferase [Photobacterium kishitanii]